MRKRSAIATSNTDRKKRRTSITSPAGRSCISAATVSPSSAIRPARCTASTATCSAPSSIKNAEDNIIQRYVKDSTLPYVDVEIKNVILDDLRQSPYSARIEFEKVYSNPADHSELKRERWTASVTYVFRENVKNNELAVNPLGLTIVRFRADQAFS